MAEVEAACRYAGAEVHVQRQSSGGAAAARGWCSNEWRLRDSRTCLYRTYPDVGRSTKDRAAARGGSRKTPLNADVLSKRSGSGDDACFDFHLLRLAIQLADQVVDRRNHRGDVADNQLVRAVIRKNIAAGRQKLLQRVLHRGR